MKKAIIALSSLIVIFIAILVFQYMDFGKGVDYNTSGDQGEYYNRNKGKEGKVLDKNGKLIDVDTDPNSYTMIVNRDYPMPADYVPPDLEVPDVKFSFSGTYEKSYMRKAAAEAVESMFAAAQDDNYSLKIVSAYRSYERQEAIYNNNVRSRGESSTDKVSAKPGCSEHQTGLCVDISSDSVDCTIEESFGASKEGIWVAKNCYKYGFIIRYPKEKADITGYSYEPWHIRYVGKNLAKYLYDNKLTLEEYYQTTTVDNKVPQDEQISDADSNPEPSDEPQMTAAPTPKTTAYPTAEPEEEPTSEPELDNTKKPEETKKPKPEKTKKPKATKKPKVTKKPVATKKPVTTKKPVVTQKPVETVKPEKTEEPRETQSPEENQDESEE